MLLAQISLTISCHSSLHSIAFDWSSRLHPVSAQSCCKSVVVGRLTLARPCEVVNRRTSLISSSLLLQQCPACLVHLTWMVLEIEGRLLYSSCFVGCCFQDSFNTAYGTLVQFPSSFCSICLVCINLVHPYRRSDTTAAWEKMRFILSDKSDFHMIDNLLIAVHVFATCILIWFSVDEILLPK